MEKEVFVYADLDGVPHLVGRLRGRVRKNKEGATDHGIAKAEIGRMASAFEHEDLQNALGK